MTTTVIGFDSAWTDRLTAPGAVCAIRGVGTGSPEFVAPELATFAQALEVILREAAQADRCLVAIDQPTIVPNQFGSRPVDKVAASLISFVGGGVQPANRSKLGMFNDTAPIWNFKHRLSATEDPELARSASSGLHIMEVFPALALPSCDDRFHGRLSQPKNNPANARKFSHTSWVTVVDVVDHFGRNHEIHGLGDWCDLHRNKPAPRKADQDSLDAVICALVGVHWLSAPREASIMIGDLTRGYMVAPVSTGVRRRLEDAGRRCGVEAR